jgi:hypothetical protein
MDPSTLVATSPYIYGRIRLGEVSTELPSMVISCGPLVARTPPPHVYRHRIAVARQHRNGGVRPMAHSPTANSSQRRFALALCWTLKSQSCDSFGLVGWIRLSIHRSYRASRGGQRPGSRSLRVCLRSRVCDQSPGGGAARLASSRPPRRPDSQQPEGRVEPDAASSKLPDARVAEQCAVRRLLSGLNKNDRTNCRFRKWLQHSLISGAARNGARNILVCNVFRESWEV